MKRTPTIFTDTEVKNHNPDQKFQIAPEAFDAIMEILSGMYPDIVLAVAREIGSNAYDANIVSGTTKPVEFNLTLEPFISLTGETKGQAVFSVKDNGPGLDFNDIENIYTRYGITQKGDSNDFNGGFGIGSKSVFALTNYFEVVSNKNGKKLGFGFTLEENQGAFYDVYLDEPTDEPNGVTVKIPLKTSEFTNMEKKLDSLFFTWPVGSYLVNGAIPETQKALHDVKNFLPIYDIAGEPLAWVSVKPIIPVTTHYQPTTEVRKQYFHPGHQAHKAFVNRFERETTYMGGAEYASPVSTLISRSYYDSDPKTHFYRHHKIIWNLPIGSVKITPDRSAIKDTPANVQKIKAFQQLVFDSIPLAATEHASTLPPGEAEQWIAHNEALLFGADMNLLEVNGKLYNNTFTLMGMSGDVPCSEIVKGKSQKFDKNAKLYRTAVYRNSSATFDKKSLVGKVVNVLIWGVYEGKAANVYRDLLPAVRDQLNVYVDSDNLFVLHVATNTKPSKAYTDGWLVLNVNDLTEYRKSFTAKMAKIKEPVEKKKEVLYGVTPGHEVGVLTPEIIEQATKLMYVQEVEISAQREWLKEFEQKTTPKRIISYSARLLPLIFPEYTIVMLPNNRVPKTVVKLNPDAVNFTTVLQEKIDSFNPNQLNLAIYVNSMWKLKETKVPPAHEFLATTITQVKTNNDGIRSLIDLINMVKTVDAKYKVDIKLPEETDLTFAVKDIMNALRDFNVGYFNKLMELYPGV